MKGWVYIITNKAMPDLLKVGFSTKDPESRADELYTTGIPHRYIVEYDVLVDGPFIIEQKAHKLLKAHHEDKEWFRCDITTAITAIRQAANHSIILESNKHNLINDNRTTAEQGNVHEQPHWLDQYLKEGNVHEQSHWSDPYLKKGDSYTNGNSITEDYLKALEWYLKAAEARNTTAQSKIIDLLADLYRKGNGVTQDYSEALEWLRKAAEQGNEYAQYNLGQLYTKLAELYTKGDGVTQDYSEAIEWYFKAAEQGNADAQYNLGLYYSNGFDVNRNHSMAYDWYLRAAKQ